MVDLKNPTRRTMLTGSLGAAGLFGLSMAMEPTAQAATSTNLPTVSSTDLFKNFDFTTTPEWHLARRACTAPTPQIAAEIKTLGISKWLDQQIDWKNIDDSEYEYERTTYFPMYGMSGDDLAKKSFGFSEVYAGYLGRSVLHEQWRTRRQLKASLANFFNDLLSISAVKVEKQSAVESVNAVRDNALGKYSDMLKAMEYSRGMNWFLDNLGNTREFPNQNLGRELLELHTVGVGNHTQADVLAASNVLTGMVDGSGYRVTFDPSRHVNGSVSVCGWSDSNPGGSETACRATFDSMLNHLAHHPATAKRIATRMVTHYVSDNAPQGLIDRLAKIYLDNDTAIAPMVKALFTSDEFNASVGQKIRRPQIVAASALAAGGRKPNYAGMVPYEKSRGFYFQDVADMVNLAGHGPFTRTFPDGFPLTNRPWVTGTSLLSLVNLEQLAFYKVANITNVDWMAACGVTPTDRYITALPKAIAALTGWQVTNQEVWRPFAAAWASDVGTLPNVYGIGPSSRFTFAVASIFASPLFLVS